MNSESPNLSRPGGTRLRGILAGMLAGLLAGAAIASLNTVGSPPLDPVERPEGAALTELFLQHNANDLRAAMVRAKTFVDGITLDPKGLEEGGVSAKRKLGELLGAYVELWQVASEQERAQMRGRLEIITATTRDPSFHDLLTVDEARFKRDATSYMRIAYLMKQVGLDTSEYRRQLALAMPRFDKGIAQRGPHQQMTFNHYYAQLGFRPPVDLVKPLRESFAKPRPPAFLIDEGNAYELAHEVAAAYELGTVETSPLVDRYFHAYLRDVLSQLTAHYLLLKHTDLTSELILTLRVAGLHDEVVYRDGLTWLIRSQLGNGSWGAYEKERAEIGPIADQVYSLHTTYVAMMAIGKALGSVNPGR